MLTAAVTWIYRRAGSKAVTAVNSFLIETWGEEAITLVCMALAAAIGFKSPPPR